MKYNDLKTIISIPVQEKMEFKSLIKKYRGQLISTPSQTVERVFIEYKKKIESVRETRDISNLIQFLREAAYRSFLVEEAEFNVAILKHITENLETPSEIYSVLVREKLNLHSPEGEIVEQIKSICGEYAGRISPYIYELCLSNTQSRRSRAGKTFEAIIYKMYEAFDYEFSSQKQVGKATFEDKGLGKIVDSLLPNIQAFDDRRDKVIIGTMKTTLRERWQEVIEELQRTGLPSIHLLTMDDNISKSKAEQMGRHNVIIVVHKDVKQAPHLREKRNIVSFETYFLEEIPETMRYWNR
tara:strand:- start:353 stop:1246 length:894 start_codon:yes stop_codon:yes gene_type:complete